MIDVLRNLVTNWLTASKESGIGLAKRLSWFIPLVILFLVLRYFEPEIAWTSLILAVAAFLATRIYKLRKWRFLIYAALVATLLWRPFWIHVLPKEATISVTSKEDHEGIFVVAAELDDGTTEEFEVRDTELFAWQFNRDYLWSQFQEGKKTTVRYYGMRMAILHLYPKVFYADRIDG